MFLLNRPFYQGVGASSVSLNESSHRLEAATPFSDEMGGILKFARRKRGPWDDIQGITPRGRSRDLIQIAAGVAAGIVIGTGIAILPLPDLRLPELRLPEFARNIHNAVQSQSISEPRTERITFGLCHTGGGTNCVVDGDTFWFGGQRVRMADIDAPETHPPRCTREAELGRQATLRLQQLLSEGPIQLNAIDRDQDKYGRLLKIVTRDGRSVGGILVSEGLARSWTGSRRPWC